MRTHSRGYHSPEHEAALERQRRRVAAFLKANHLTPWAKGHPGRYCPWAIAKCAHALRNKSGPPRKCDDCVRPLDAKRGVPGVSHGGTLRWDSELWDHVRSYRVTAGPHKGALIITSEPYDWGDPSMARAVAKHLGCAVTIKPPEFSPYCPGHTRLITFHPVGVALRFLKFEAEP